MFRDYRLSIGDRMRKAPMGYFSEQRLGSIQTVLTSTVNELEQYLSTVLEGVFHSVHCAHLFVYVASAFSFRYLVLS